MEQVIAKTAFISGTYAAQFESDFAVLARSRPRRGCANGTDALEIMLDASVSAQAMRYWCQP